MEKPDETKYTQRPVLLGIIVFLALFALSQYVTYQRYVIKKQLVDKRAENAVNQLRDRLQTSLNYSLSASKTLSYIIKQYGVPKNFDSVARTLIESNKCIDAIELVQGEVITHIYPLRGNEVVIGYNILRDSLRNKEALKAIAKKELFFAGPLELKQGGMAVVGRLPIFIKDTFFGFSVVIIKLSTLVKAMGLNNVYNEEFVFQLSKINTETGREEYFLSGDTSFVEGHSASVPVPNGDWMLKVKPRHNPGLGSLLLLIIIGFLLAVTSGYFTYFVARQPIIMDKKVQEKTEQLIQSEKRYHDLFELSPLPAFVLSPGNLNILNVNKSAEKHYGYSRSEMLSMSMKDLIAENSEKQRAVNLMKGNFLPGNVFSHRKKSGEIIQVEVLGNSIQYYGEEAELIIANNITERQKYISAIEAQNNRIREIAWIQSHIVRAPLARIMGIVDVLKEKDASDEDMNDMLDKMIDSASQLDDIITDISMKAHRINKTFDDANHTGDKPLV